MTEDTIPDEIDLKIELKGGVAIYAVLAFCALVSLVPAFMTDAIPDAPAEMSVSESIIVQDVRGLTVDLTDFDNTALVLSFFATDDPASKQQLLNLKSLRETVQNNALGILAICVSPNKWKETAALASEVGVPFPVIMCSPGIAGDMMSRRDIPFLVVQNADGQTLKAYRRLVTAEELSAVIDKMLR